MISTPFTETFRIDHPITCGGMLGVENAELIAAVAEAGALGFLPGLSHPTPELLAREIERTTQLTDRTFGVNLTILPTIQPVPYDDYVDVIIESGVRFVETAGRSPAPYMEKFARAGIKVVHKAVAVRHAISAEKMGVDAVSIDGFECAGHPGEEHIGGIVLIPAATSALDIPVVASGGIADGRGLAAALALGASAVNMGTRFVATAESTVHENVKKQIVANDERMTNVVFQKFANSARVAKNLVSDEIVEIEKLDGTTFADVAHLASGARGREEVLRKGGIDGGVWRAGQSQGLIYDVPTVGVLIARMVDEAERVLERLASLSTP